MDKKVEEKSLDLGKNSVLVNHFSGELGFGLNGVLNFFEKIGLHRDKTDVLKNAIASNHLVADEEVNELIKAFNAGSVRVLDIEVEASRDRVGAIPDGLSCRSDTVDVSAANFIRILL